MNYVLDTIIFMTTSMFIEFNCNVFLLGL